MATPPIKWAQRKDAIFIEVAVADIEKDAKIVLQVSKLEFAGKSHGKDYKADLEFFAEVDPQDVGSKFDVKARSILFHIIKKDKDAAFWPRLLKDKLKEKNQVQIDWSRYADEDEAEEKGGFDTSSFGPGAMNFGGGDDDGGMGGMGGMMGGGMGGLGGMMGGGMGGPGGMDMEALMRQFGGGAGGLGGLGGGDFGGAGGAGGEDEGDDDDLPDLEADSSAGDAKPE